MSVEAYYPELLPPKNIKEEEFKDLIMKINLEIGRFDGMLRYNPHKEVVQAFLRAEEVLSSASMEISELSFDEYLDKLLDRGYEADDLVEIRFMLDYYIEQNLIVEEKGFSLNILDNFQEKLLENRQKRRLAQNELYRKRQIWLIEAAEEFDVRLHMHTDEDKINVLMDNLDNFIRKSKCHPLITAAIAYGQLAMIHPWRYANGRITGALIPYMFNFLGITSARSFYLSGAFRKGKDEYYHQLVKLFRTGDWPAWIKFFLEKVKEQAVSGQKKLNDIINYSSKLENHILKEIFTKDIKIYSELLLTHPIFTPKELERESGLPDKALDRYIYYLLETDYLTKDNRKRYINYMFTKLNSLFNM